MAFSFKKVLLVYKKSAYAIYFRERRIKLAKSAKANLQKEIRRYKKAHDQHYATLKQVERTLRKYGIQYTKCSRGRKVSFSRYDLIITVGGDGTFLEAAKQVRDQAIIGVNSTPKFSVGKLCTAQAGNFEKLLRRLRDGKAKFTQWPRLRLKLEDHARAVDCVNDILICHGNPAALSRYYLSVEGLTEEQRSSGLWVATAAGSSGAVHSAGGQILKPVEKIIQYRPRELHYGFRKKYRHKGGLLHKRKTLTVTSLMHDGMIFIDGMHNSMKFPYNTTLKVQLSPNPIKTFELK